MFTIPLSIEYKKVLSALLRKLLYCPITKLGKINEYPCTHDTSKAQKRLSAMMVWKWYSSLFDKTIKKVAETSILMKGKTFS